MNVFQKRIQMRQPKINLGIARITCGFVIVILFMSVFTFIVGFGDGVATSSGQVASLEPDDNNPYLPGIGDVAFIDSSHAWAVNRSGTALYHLKEGAPLRTQVTNFGARPVISFVDQKIGFAFAQMRLWRTTDSGQTWQKVADLDQTNPDLRLTSVLELHFVDERQGWLADVFGIWRTQDGGAHWQRVFSTADSKDVDALAQVSFRGSEHALVAARQGVYLTFDGGKNWNVNHRKSEFLAVYLLDERTSWAWGEWLERTDDGGKTWRKLYKLKEIIEVNSIQFINKNEGWAAGLEIPESFASVVRNPSAPKFWGVLLHTKDGGKSWDHSAVPTDRAFFHVAFSNSKHGWLSGWERVYRTNDGGLTWTTALEVSASQ